MKILKGYVFRLYPNEKQEHLINKTIGCSRFIYNYFLNDKIKEYKETGKSKSAYDQIKLIPSLSKEYPWLKEVDSCGLRNSLFDLDNAYKNFFNGSGYPKFKAKGVHESYKTNNIKSSYKGNNYNSIKLDLKNKIITLPKLKEVKIRGYRNKEVMPGEIKSAIIKKDAGRYYVSVLVEEELIRPAFVPKSIIGLDLGIKDLIVTSFNEKIENKIKLNTKRMIGLQRGFSRCKPGSKNRYKIKLKIQRLFQKIRNARKHMIHDITNKLIKENDIIVTENLDVKGMQKNHYVAKGLNENPISEIIRVLKYKTNWNNKKLNAKRFPNKVNSLILIGTPYKIPKFLFKVQGIIFHLMQKSTFEKIGCLKKDFITLVNSMSNLDMASDLDKIECRTLILCGEKDNQNMEGARLLNKSIKDSEFKIIKNASHEVNIYNPDETFNMINDFWR